MLAIKRSHFLRRILLEDFLRRDSRARSSPHIGHIQILGAIVVVIQPADTHARADIFHSRLRRDICKCPIAIVTVKILAAEIIHHV